jgi:hypothetical protein
MVTSAAAVTLNKPPIKQENRIQRSVCMRLNYGEIIKHYNET